VTTLRVWAPYAQRVDAVLGDNRQPMVQDRGGWWSIEAADATHGTDYAFSLDGGDPRPDPRSLWQPDGVHRASRIYDHDRFEWSDGDWRGKPLQGSVVYELHIGTFTPTGTLDSAIERLDHLVDLGIDLVEILPVASVDGARNWGYDGVGLYAVHEPYGGPDALKRFVDACHARGLGVVLDVVYNHLGPSGNYLGEFGPYFTDRYSTPWGDAVNLDAAGSDEVHRFVLDNLVSWLTDFHVDGLRLDAVHELLDNRALTLLEEIGRVAHSVGEASWPRFTIAESDRNDPRTVTPVAASGVGMDAQWCDDIHHSLHAALTGERQGYYVDFGALSTLATVMTSAFFHAGSFSTFRSRSHGRPVDPAVIPGHRFVAFLQDHDQVGNRATGDRLAAVVSPGRLKIGAALLLCSPFTPMLFMGEEWAAATPWQFFTSFPDPKLGRAVSQGRRSEFAEHGWAEADVPDPQDPATFERSRLDWAELERPAHRELLDWHRDLIALRRSRPELGDDSLLDVRCEYDEDAEWFVLHRGPLAVVCNLAESAQPVELAVTDILLASDGSVRNTDGRIELGPDSCAVVTAVVTTEDPPLR
jgi:maltooligosyltrehalose trehalohydrolase